MNDIYYINVRFMLVLLLDDSSYQSKLSHRGQCVHTLTLLPNTRCVQAMARVWRDGQKKAVRIYRLLTAGENATDPGGRFLT